MITDLDETIKQLLIDNVPLDINEVDVVFEAPTEEWSSSLARPTINCYLYHMVENHELRVTDWEFQRNVPARAAVAGGNSGQGNGNGNGEKGAVSPSKAHTGIRRHPPYRIDCFYVITAWANEPEDEHRLIWRLTAALMRYNNHYLPAEKLKGDLGEQPWPILAKVIQPEGPIKNPTDFWSSMEVPVRASVSLQITLPLDPDIYVEIPMVLTRRIRAFPIEDYSQREEVPGIQFGGWVLSETGSGTYQTVHGADVLIVEKGTHTESDSQGRFKFDYVGPGTYTLRATYDGARVERTIQVPQDEYDLMLPRLPDGDTGERVTPGPRPGGRPTGGRSRDDEPLAPRGGGTDLGTAEEETPGGAVNLAPPPSTQKGRRR